MLYLLETQLNGMIITFMMAFTRISAMFMTSPVIGTRLMPSRIRLMLSLVITIVIMPTTEINKKFETLLSLDIFLLLLSQIIIGIVIGVALQIIFQIFLLLGEIIAMQSGLGFAVLNDPSTNAAVPMVSQIYLMVVTLLFLSFEGHLASMILVVESMNKIPLDQIFFSSNIFGNILPIIGWMFSSAFSIAIPAVTALLIVNVAFGVMTRAAPQLNIFSIGFPITMMLGVVILWMNLDIIKSHFWNLFSDGFLLIEKIILG